MLGQSRFQVLNQNLSSLSDQALQKNISSLANQAENQSAQIFSDQLEISGHNLKINCQSLMGSKGQTDFYLVTVTPMDGIEGAA